MLKKDQYLKTVRRPYPPLFLSLMLHGLSNPKYYRDFLDKECCMKDMILSDFTWYYSKNDLRIASKNIFEHWLNAKNLKKVIKLLKKRENALVNSTGKDFDKYVDAYESYAPALVLVWCIESLVTEKVRTLLSQKLSSPEVEKLISDLNIPIQDNFYKSEEYELITTKDLKAHVKKYGWIHSRYGEVKSYTLSEAVKKRATIDKKKLLTELNNQKIHVKKSIAYAKNVLSKEGRIIIDLMQFIVFYRTQRTDIINMSQYLYAPKLKALAKTKHVTYKELLLCTKEEIQNKLPSRPILSERTKNYAAVLENKKIYCVSGSASDKIRKMLNEKIERVNELKGSIACQGFVKGKARIIMSTKDFPDFKKGEILVTSMTNPHMVPIMKKAAAFVTDEGGITCHAAIMSREMKKPCVIGTKFATQVFKTGDLVEVDANKGIIRKL